MVQNDFIILDIKRESVVISTTLYRQLNQNSEVIYYGST